MATSDTLPLFYSHVTNMVIYGTYGATLCEDTKCRKALQMLICCCHTIKKTNVLFMQKLTFSSLIACKAMN